MAFKTISGTVELTTGAYTPSETSPVYQLENGATLLSLDLENDGSPYTLTGSESAYVKMYFTANNTETAYVLMDKATGNISVELTNVLTAIAGQAVAFIKITGSDDALLFSCKIPIPILRTSGTAVTSYEEPAAGTVAYLEGLIDAKQDLLITGGVVKDDGVGNVSAANHNDIANKQGGTTGEYYHLTAAELAQAQGAVRYDALQSLSDAQKLQACKNILAGRSNKNLLHNWYLKGLGGANQFPVNQRGLTTYTRVSANLETIDRWRIEGNGEIILGSNGISFEATASGGAFVQRIENYADLDGKQVAFSVIIDGTLYECTGTIDMSLNAAVCSFTHGVFDIALRTYGGIYLYVVFLASAASLIENIEAVKVEEGSYSTLLYDLRPDYGKELAKCQRYATDISIVYGYGHVTSSVNAYVAIPTPTPMRIIPSITVNSVGVLKQSDGSSFTPTGISIITMSANIIYLAVSASGLTTNMTVVLEDAVIFFTADM